MESRGERLLGVVGAALLVASLLVRLLGYPLFTTDYTYFVAMWFQDLQTHPGLTAFQFAFADYAPMYLYLLKLLIWVPVSSLYISKTLSLLFDVVIAAYAVQIVREHAPRPTGRGALLFVFALMFAIPTMIVNSSVWGQSDSIYAAGVIAALYYMLGGRPGPAAVAVGLALSVKVQAIFFVPVFVGWCLRRGTLGRTNWRYILVPPLVYAATIVPAWLGGGSYAAWFLMYLHQAREYTDLSVSAQSIFAFVTYLPLAPIVSHALFWAGVIAALAAAVAVAWLVARSPLLTPERLVYLSILSALALPYLLPRMHERYFYLADIFSVLYAIYCPRRWYIPVVVVCTSLMSYVPFLSPQLSWFAPFHVDLRIPAAIVFVLLGWLVVLLLRARALQGVSPPSGLPAQ